MFLLTGKIWLHFYTFLLTQIEVSTKICVVSVEKKCINLAYANLSKQELVAYSQFRNAKLYQSFLRKFM